MGVVSSFNTLPPTPKFNLYNMPRSSSRDSNTLINTHNGSYLRANSGMVGLLNSLIEESSCFFLDEEPLFLGPYRSHTVNRKASHGKLNYSPEKLNGTQNVELRTAAFHSLLKSNDSISKDDKNAKIIRWRENVNLPESENVSKETETDDPNDAWDYKELERKRGISEPPDANQSNHSWREFTPFSGERRTLLLKEDDCRSLCTEPTGYCTRARCRQGFYCLCKKFADAQA